MFGSIGMPELIIILVIALIIFGPRKLPELGKSLGRSLNEFKKASTDLQNTLEQEIKIEEQKENAAKAKAEEKTASAPSIRTRNSTTRKTTTRTPRRREKRFRAPRHPSHRTHRTHRGSSSIPKPEPQRRRAEPAREAGRVLAVW